MAKSSEEISKSNLIGGKPDTNLANDALHLGGIPADEFATEKYVQEYHEAKENLLKEYIDEQDALKLQQAKSYTDVVVRNQDFSSFAKVTDVQALDDKLSDEITEGLNTQKNYTDGKVSALARDVNENFEDVGQSITSLNRTTQELFTSVSNGKSTVAAAITDKGVSTASNASFNTMAENIRKIETGGGEPDPYYVNTGDATAESNDILLGKTAYVKGNKVYGNYVALDTSDATATSSDIKIGESAYVNGEKIIGTSYMRDTSDATATPYDILVGKTAYVQDQKITGILDMSGATPTYASDDGVEKIYGGSSRDYRIGNISANSNFHDVLFNSVSNDIIATIQFTGSNLILRYIVGNVIGMTRTIDLSSIITDIKNQLQTYDSYSDEKFTIEYIGVTRANINNPFLCFHSHYGNSERIISLIPIVETRTPSNGATIITWEIDTTNIIHRALSKMNQGSPRDVNLPGYVYEDGSRVLINGERDKSSVIINIDNENWEITSVHSVNLTVDPGGYIRTIQTPQKIIPSISDRILICSAQDHIYALLFDENGTPKKYVHTGISHYHNEYYYSVSTISSDVKYAIVKSGTIVYIYSLTIDLNNYTISKNQITTYDWGSYTDYNFYFMSGNSLLIASKTSGTDEIFSFTPTENNVLTLLKTGDYYVGLGGYLAAKPSNLSLVSNQSKIIADTLLLTKYTTYNEIRYINAVRNYQDLIALKYNGEYYYPQRGGVLTAGQGDVRAGKTFIGWMGYEETGTMEVE